MTRTPDSDSEKSLQDSHLNVLALKEGDQSALGRLADSLRPYLIQVVRNELTGMGSPGLEDASDIVQQTMVRAIEGIEGFRGTSRQEWQVWLAAIARNEVRMTARFWGSQKRSRRRTVGIEEVLLVGSEDSPSAELNRNELASELDRALARLTAAERQIIAWRQNDGLSHAEIAERLGISVDASRQRCKSAMDALRKEYRQNS